MIIGFEQYKEKWQLSSDSAIKPGLEAMQGALAKLGNPEQGTRFIHVAGTNGKGSTIAFLERMLMAHGLKVGKFMSPCVLDVHDQIQINGQNISGQQMDAVCGQMKEAGIHECTDFELLTCAAFLYFRQQQVDIALIETGMGGLLDSTNVLTPLVSIISSIALEHTNFLGNTIEEITRHKAGIIKRQVPVVIGELPADARRIIEETAANQQAELWILGRDFFIADTSFSNNQLELAGLQRKMSGPHQAHNMALALQAFCLVAEKYEMPIQESQLQESVAQAELAGRFEEVRPHVYMDGAHNPASIEKLVETIKQQFPRKNIEFVVGMLADKDVDTVLRSLETVSTTFTFIDFHNERAMRAIDLLKKSQAPDRRIAHDIAGYLEAPKEEHTIKIVTGSLYLLASLREQLMKK